MRSTASVGAVCSSPVRRGGCGREASTVGSRLSLTSARRVVAWNDPITEKQLKMIYALKSQLGLKPNYLHFAGINRQQAKELIDGLIAEVEALQNT